MAEINLGKVKGEDGQNVYIKYNSEPVDANATDHWSLGQAYIGIVTSTSKEKPESGYSWSKFVGEAASIVQTTGSSTTAVISQKAVTDELNIKYSPANPPPAITFERIYKPNAAGRVPNTTVSASGLKIPLPSGQNIGSYNYFIVTGNYGTSAFDNPSQSFSMQYVAPTLSTADSYASMAKVSTAGADITLDFYFMSSTTATSFLIYRPQYRSTSGNTAYSATAAIWITEIIGVRGVLTENTPAVNSVNISPAALTMSQGATQQLTAIVDAVNGAFPDVIWSISGNFSSNTKISATGLLTIAQNEFSESLTVTATSIYDTGRYGSSTVNVIVVENWQEIYRGPFVDSIQNSLITPDCRVRVKLENINCTWRIYCGCSDNEMSQAAILNGKAVAESNYGEGQAYVAKDAVSGCDNYLIMQVYRYYASAIQIYFYSSNSECLAEEQNLYSPENFIENIAGGQMIVEVM